MINTNIGVSKHHHVFYIGTTHVPTHYVVPTAQETKGESISVLV